ncbi:MAG: hypothetical protein OXP09_07145 [Gammaproteobacteria bacterium]|nr:hypothetical protein [Rhodospirillaceae bacterium]MDE0365336.1 hypothetical protein [Gammaproteobacteria bacterium]
MVDECYAEDCEVSDMLRNRTFHGREELCLIEQQMMAIDASRRLTVVNMVAADLPSPRVDIRKGRSRQSEGAEAGQGSPTPRSLLDFVK